MPLVEGIVSLPSPSLIKMEERKRPAGDDDSAPPLKRQATSVNGTSKPHVDADMPWQDDLEVSLAPLVGSSLASRGCRETLVDGEPHS